MVEHEGSKRSSPFFRTKPGLSLTLMAILTAGVFSTALPMILQKAYAVGTLEDLVITANDARTGVTTSYTITTKTDTKGKIEAVKIDFPAAYSIADCALPCGTYTLAGISKLKSNGEFSAVAADDTITYNMSRTTAIKAGVQFSLTIEGIVNPSDAESYSITVTTLDKNGNAIDSDSDDLTISSSLSSTDADDGLTIENTGGSITIDASNDLSLEADGSTIKLDARDDATAEIEITDSIDGATGGVVTLNAALTIGTINDGVTISGTSPKLTLSETDGTLLPTEAALLVSSDNFAIQTDNAAGALTTRLQINGGTNAGTFTLGDANADTFNLGSDAGAAIDTINLLTGADGTADVFNLGGTGADDINIGSATSVLSITSTGLNVVDAGTISDADSEVFIDDTFKLGNAGTSITDITVGQVADGASGWNPDGALGLFTVTASAAAITTDSVIIISLDNGSAALSPCTVTDVTAGASFVIRCSVATIPDGAVLNYMIVDP